MIRGPARLQVEGTGRVQLSRTVYNFTDAQDVRVLVGYRAHVSDTGRVVGVRAPRSAPAPCPARGPVRRGARTCAAAVTPGRSQQVSAPGVRARTALHLHKHKPARMRPC